MKATINGLVLEKFQREKNKELRHYIRLYQQGEKENLDVVVTSKTYNTLEVGKQIELKDVTIGAYYFRDKVGMFAREEA